MDQNRSVQNATPGTEEDDPLVEECLGDALGPYLGTLSPEEAAEYREFLIVLMQTHPATAALYQRLRKRPAVETSGDITRAGATTETLPERADGTSGGRRR